MSGTFISNTFNIGDFVSFNDKGVTYIGIILNFKFIYDDSSGNFLNSPNYYIVYTINGNVRRHYVEYNKFTYIPFENTSVIVVSNYNATTRYYDNNNKKYVQSYDKNTETYIIDNNPISRKNVLKIPYTPGNITFNYLLEDKGIEIFFGTQTYYKYIETIGELQKVTEYFTDMCNKIRNLQFSQIIAKIETLEFLTFDLSNESATNLLKNTSENQLQYKLINDLLNIWRKKYSKSQAHKSF